MKLFPGRILLALLLLGTFLAPARAAGSPQLKNIYKQDDLAGTRLLFAFSQMPEYRMAGSGQRMDIFFAGTTVVPDLQLPQEDGRILKVLLAQSREELMVSLLLRQVPARVFASTEKTAPAVRLELFWEEESDERPAIAFRISGLPARQEHTAVSSPGKPSSYQGRWKFFFEEYQGPFSIQAPLAYSMPELPIPSPDLFPPEQSELLTQIARGDWSNILSFTAANPSKPFRGTALNLLRAEALLRENRPQESLALLEAFHPGTLPSALEERSTYLHALALAQCAGPYRARNRLAMSPPLSTSRFYPYFQLLEGELALARGDFQDALEIFRSRKSDWPVALKDLRQLRTADALTDLEPGKAAKIYRSLSKKEALFRNKPFSLSRAGQTFFRSRAWKEAEKTFQDLAAVVEPGPDAGMARFAAALSSYRGGNKKEAHNRLWQLQKDYPGTECARRARMKLLDHDVFTAKDNPPPQTIRGFEVLAKEAGSRALREEAAFKYSLALFLGGDRLRTVETLDSFCRDFARGPLRREAEALLAEFLPPLLEKLIGEGKDLQAVILVEKYRELLLERSGQWPFLPALARAFTRLGLLERGCKVYLYLLEKADTRVDADLFYLPLVNLLFDMDAFQAVEKYTRRYLAKFPMGKDRNTVFLRLVQSLTKMNRFEDAAKLLQEPKRPSDNQIELAAERVFWQLGEYGWVITCAGRLGDDGQSIPPEGLLLQAEALQRLGRGKQALPLYQVLAEDGTFGDQATYRCGEILLTAGRRKEALKFLRQLVEKEEGSLWKKLAEDSIESAKYY